MEKRADHNNFLEESMPESMPKSSQNANFGSLKIFFGYAAGVGKTYAMLAAAHSAKKAGIDVVAGYVEPHMRPETQALLEGLERLPTLTILHHTASLQEFDLDAAIKRKPQLILVDEMAHTNAKDCRHVKRYQDIQELLRQGIDVYTTVNVQHVESLHDVVESITGITVRERVPDKVFDSADHVEVVDIEPEELLSRLKQGKIYRPEQAKTAIGNFFVKENLVALREIALRRTADIISRTVDKNKSLTRRSDYFTNEHLLVCLSSSPSNAKVIRTAARMAEVFHGKLTALFVETSNTMSEENKDRLEANTKLAQELGASLAAVEGDDVPWHVAEFAKASSISKIVIGRPGKNMIWLFRKPNFIDQLTELAPDLDIYVIPNNLKKSRATHRPLSNPLPLLHISITDVAWGLIFLFASTVVGLAFHQLNFNESTIIMTYMLGVLLAALHTSGLLFSTIYALCSVLAFNFFFTEPRFSFQVYNQNYLITFVIMLLTSGITSTLAKRLQQQKVLASQLAYRTTLLLETSQKLQMARDSKEIIHETGRQLMQLLNRTIIIYPSHNDRLIEPIVIKYGEQNQDISNIYTSKKERSVAQWSFNNRKQAGAGAKTLSGACCFYLCIRGQEEALGVAAVAVDDNPLDSFEKSLFMSVLGECGLALEKERSRESKDIAFMQAKQESLRANMLRAISHDLRTPLTSISGNAHLLRTNSQDFTKETCQRLYTDIYDDAAWLISLVENILSVTRLEDGSLPLKLEPELVADCINEALRHIHRRSEEHEIKVYLEDDLLLAHMDSRLIMQVIINMVDNAIKYTPEGSTITIQATKNKENIAISIGDNGIGIPDEAKAHLFDMFFTASPNADSRRGLGLGLSLCKSIITAHKGQIKVEDNFPTGSLFTFTLEPAELNHA